MGAWIQAPAGTSTYSVLGQYGNVTTLRLSRLVIPGMQARRWGRIIHLTSLVAKQPMDELTISSTLRAGLSGLTKTLANQVGPDNITVNAVLPGNIITEGLVEMACSLRIA